MSQNKKDQFHDDYIRIADFAKALSHPARIAILHRLALSDTCICGEIVEVMPLSQSTVSQHLKELKKAGLIKGKIDGNRSCYCIDRDKLNEFEKSFISLIDSILPDCCKKQK
jgi:DNA-binding transcriptional ArsR family regulator